MIEYILSLNYILQALIATLFTWFVTLLGAFLVYFFKNVNKSVMDAMLGFAAGIMISASFWSLLLPALEMAKLLKMVPVLIVALGFFLGGCLLFLGDRFFDLFYKNKENKYKRSMLLILSITLHNIPEGLAIGVAFGSLAYGLDKTTIEAAWLLAIGIGLQNFPEGTAISIPLLREGFSRKKAFMYGQLSGIVEPISGVIGAFLVVKINSLLPFLLAFAAGAMIYVVVAELIPESQSNKNKDFMALFTIIGFLVMMILDVTLG